MEQLEVGQALKAAASETLPKMLSTQQMPSASMPHNMTAPAKSSRYRGVTLFRPTLKWRSQVCTPTSNDHLKPFPLSINLNLQSFIQDHLKQII